MEKNAPLWRKTTFRIGGPADLIVYPETAEELSGWLAKGEVSLVLGGGSNLLVSDKGVRGVVIGMEKWRRKIDIVEADDGSVLVTVSAGARLSWLSGMLMKKSLAGLEFGYGIPGTVGGALIMNAGAADAEMKDIVESVTIVTCDGEIKKLDNNECGFGYRSSNFPDGAVITETELRFEKGDREKINEKMLGNHARRRVTQPLDLPSAGSIFKNPQGEYAGRLIDEAGLKGLTVGDAQVSEKHANFIVNLGNAKAADVLRLMEKVEQKVMERFCVKLEREARVVGEF